MITISNLQFQYPGGDFALQVPTLNIARGETVAVIGPSGTGKTTLLDLMAGFRVPGQGSVCIGERELAGLSDRERRDFRIRSIGLVFQEFELLEYLSVLDNILLPYRITSTLLLDTAVRERAASLAREVGLEKKLRRNATRLSQGERQRVAICRALLPEPDLLLCDEPTGNLDPANKDHVLDILFRYTLEHQTTLVVVTHDHDLLPRFSRIIDFKDLAPPSEHDSTF